LMLKFYSHVHSKKRFSKFFNERIVIFENNITFAMKCMYPN
jgi:hypothetical protein